jgi:hypothetical protein
MNARPEYQRAARTRDRLRRLAKAMERAGLRPPDSTTTCPLCLETELLHQAYQLATATTEPAAEPAGGQR